MKIVVLDGYTLNPGDLSWDPLRAFGPCIIYDRSSEDVILKRSRGAEAILVNKVEVNRAMVSSLVPSLKYIGVLATGYDNVDIQACKDNGITVTNVPGYSTESVAQTVFALILELTHRVGHHSHVVHQGKWSECQDFAFWDFPLVELSGKTLGIVGFGKIGKAVARIATAFGMKVLIHTRTRPNDAVPEIRHVSLEELLKESDFVSLHCPLTEQTKNLINETSLKLMKKSSYLINTGRGALIDENALKDALARDAIAGAAVDVLTKEPPTKGHPLVGLKSCIITPHFAWATKEARSRLLTIACSNLQSFLSGKATNVI